MCWDKLRHLFRSVRFRLTAAFSLVALLAAVLTVVGIVGFWSVAQAVDFDRALRVQWRQVSEALLQRDEGLPPELLAVRLEADGRTLLAVSEAARELPILFTKPHYGRHGQRKDASGFWCQTVETGTPKRHFRVCAAPLPDGSILAVAQDLQSHDFMHRQLLWGGLGAVILMGGLFLLFSSLLVRRLFRGFGHAVKTVEAMAAGDFSCRVPPLGQGEEFAHLTHAINGLAGNTERLVEDLRAVTDNIAHDLRTPITRLRTRAELALYAGGSVEALASDVAEECNGMLELITALLDIARVSHNIGVSPSAEVDLCALAEEIVGCFGVSAEEKQIALTAELPPKPLKATLAAPLLKRALANLLDNAIKFTPPGGRVVLRLTHEGGRPVFRVQDSGCGIAPEDCPRLFTRFYRADSSRTLPGFGLGLALVRALALALGGSIVLEASAPGEGSTFRLTLSEQRAPRAR